MPQRPRSHRLEAESRVAFESALGSRFVYRDESADDYGIDGTVEEFDDAERATGLRFHVQLKATDEDDLTKSLAVSIKRDTADYFRSLSLPVLMVRLRAANGALYARWFHQFDPPRAGTGAKTITFRWEPGDLADANTPGRLVEEANAFLRLRSPSLQLPLELYLETDANGAYGLNPTALRYALRTAASGLSVFSVNAGTCPPAAIRVVARDETLSFNLAEVTTATVDLDHYRAGEAGEEFASDAMVLAALAFDNIGRTDVAADLTASFLSESTAVAVPEVAWSLAATLRRARRVRVALQIAETLDASDDPSHHDASYPFMLTARWHMQSWDSEEFQGYESAMEARIARRLADGRELAAGRESYNLGHVFRGRHEPTKALKSYDRAAQHEPGYAGRPYFHEERAGVIFSAGRFDDAAELYRVTNEADPHHRIVGLRADALMFAGRYAEALTAFQHYNKLAGADGLAEWRIKERFVRFVVDQMGISSQQRDQPAAVAAVKLDYQGTSSADLVGALEDVLQLDALLAVAWFNLGRGYLDSGREEGALIAYLGAAACARWDAEAWMNVLVLGVGGQRPDIAIDALECGARIVGDEFRRQLVRWSQHPKNVVSGEQLLAIVDRFFDEQPVRQDGLLLRFLEDDGGVQEFVLGAGEEAQGG
jgi:tetratricopeptide (TPR) repeat protein